MEFAMGPGLVGLAPGMTKFEQVGGTSGHLAIGFDWISDFFAIKVLINWDFDSILIN